MARKPLRKVVLPERVVVRPRLVVVTEYSEFQWPAFRVA